MRSPRALAAASASRASAGDNHQTPISHRPAAEPHAARLGANGNALAGIRKLKDGQGNYLWQPSFTEGQPQNMLAHPVTELAAMPDVARGAMHWPSATSAAAI